ncbi:histidine kinase N-terminal 7TM domain-containing protein [Halomicrobium sp. LC1Hm]|uniref:sensor histidine kinase n=1 Tax=Halomicrobium sp. LC1Hm TaxID=2610902 RepID=UPI00129855D8|nr:histidine kinase N-terminal 7TM domain-containing protein [Halomicrobium sp. LC1Hm]QGA84242.1 Signal transduction histidine kinase, contains PAS domain [Halomicrobium sp. LC1Hm]
MIAGSWIVVASLAAGVGTLALLGRLWRYREKPGAKWFLLSLACQALWSVSYAVSLLVFDETVRLALEVLGWALLAGIAVYFLAFALAYTGRGHLVETPWYRALLTLPAVAVVLLGTNPWHGLVWDEFSVVAIAGLAGTAYELRLWAVVVATGGVLIALLGSLVLFDTVASYGRLYRREAIAVGVSTVPPLSAVVVWLYEIGPVPELNFATVLFLPHIALDAYAFVRSDMFEFHPATRREGERAAIEDLGNPVVVVDEHDRIVTLNAAAESVLGVEKARALTEPLAAFLTDETFAGPDETDRVTVDTDGRRRTYSLATTPLTASGDRLGSTVVLQDITEEIQREQRLQVLNRVVRHNLRNDMTVVRGFAEAANEATDDTEVSELLDTVEGKADDLVDLGEKARAIEGILGADRRATTVELAALLSDAVDDVDADVPIATDVPDVTVTVDADTLRVLCVALVENAVEHGSTSPESNTPRDAVEHGSTSPDSHTRRDAAEHGSTSPDSHTRRDAATVQPDERAPVRVTATVRDGGVEIAIADDGPGLPEHERDVLAAGEETDLEHSTGLGLWLASWATRRLGGDLDFEVDDGTTARLWFPVEEDGEQSAA